MTKMLIDSPSTYNSFSREDEEFSMASSQEAYRPNRNPKKNRLWLKNRKKSIKTSSFNRSLWTLAQNTAYKQFLMGNSKLFDQDRQGRKILKINVMMSRLIKSRSADQCRSHHQKMMKYHRSIPQIIRHIEELQRDIAGSNAKEEEEDSMQRELGKTELIDFNDYEGEMQFRLDDGDLLEMFLTFSS